MLASSKPIHCFSPLSGKLDVGWPRIEDFQLRGHSCVNNVQRCLCHFYTRMRHSKRTSTLLLTKRHANFDTSTSAKGYACIRMRMRNCSPWHTACSGSPHNALHSSSYIHAQLFGSHFARSTQTAVRPPIYAAVHAVMLSKKHRRSRTVQGEGL